MSTKRYSQPVIAQTPDGLTLCRCGCGREVHAPRLWYATKQCKDRFKLRSDPKYLRQRVWQRDKGICSQCGRDTVAQWEALAAMKFEDRLKAAVQFQIPKHRLRTGELWDAHHVIPVCKGGGEADLSNLITLCLSCHREETAALAKERKLKI